MCIHLFISEALVSAAMYTRIKQGGGPDNQRIPFEPLYNQVEFLSQVSSSPMSSYYISRLIPSSSSEASSSTQPKAYPSTSKKPSNASKPTMSSHSLEILPVMSSQPNLALQNALEAAKTTTSTAFSSGHSSKLLGLELSSSWA